MKRTIILFLAASLLSIQSIAQKNKIKIETEHGDIVLKLYDNTPENTANMVKLAKKHYYDSTLFHRVIPKFVIQGGDPESKHAKAGQMLGHGELGYRVVTEVNDVNYHKRGAVGVARDQRPDSGSACQFYIVVGKTFTDADLDKMSQSSGRKYSPEQREVYKTTGGTPMLDGKYTVFGEVIEGMDVVDKIVNEARDHNDRPNKDVHMLKVRVKKKKFLFF
jgi:cyclophilin family peptidyl-prolyl cis-trans isomerase